jgi:hypothetical protein
MRISALRFKQTVIASALSLFLINAAVLTSTQTTRAQVAVEVGEGTGTCKWSGEDCPGGGSREVCLEDGDGNTCSCGSVTRPCN